MSFRTTEITRVEVHTRLSDACLGRVMRAIIQCRAQLKSSFVIEGDYIKTGNKPVSLVVEVPTERYTEFCSISKCPVSRLPT